MAEKGRSRERTMTNQQHGDEWWMAEVAKGRREALEPLVRRFATPLLTFLQ